MPQKDKLKRQEYNRQLYLKNKEKKETTKEIKPTTNDDNYYLLKFFKNIIKVNDIFKTVKLKPVVNKGKVNLKEAIINELKIYQEENKNKYDSFRIKYKYMMIDFKLSMKYKLLIQDLEEPDYKGYCYNIIYCKRINTKIRDVNDSKYFRNYKFLSNEEEYKKFREIEDYYKINCPDYKDKEKLEHWLSGRVFSKEMNYWIYNSECQNNKKRIMYFNSESNKPTELNTIKMRKPFKQMDYSSTPKYHYNAKNIKFWDKKTQKPSNRGLEADHTFSYINEETNHTRGWKFNGITLDEIKSFCLINGLDKIISKNYKYGDYANWILKILN